jgi:beta-lactamase regulating signal transducer with metallopeptidase domain
VTVLGLVLECAAVAAVVATAAALLSLVATSLSAGRSATRRADVAFVAALAPALVVCVMLTAALSPSVFAALGLPSSDHCSAHLNHPHLCVVHFAGLRPTAALLGAATLALVFLRAGALVRRYARLVRMLHDLEAVALTDDAQMKDPRTASGFPIVELPGAARICHAVGVFRRRMLVSARARELLTPRAWEAVRAHEDAHLTRRDPLSTMLVETALVFVPPFLAAALGNAFRRSVEGACDEVAAHKLGGGIAVAEGLLEAARVLGRSPDALAAPAATEHALEERVRGLLELEVVTRHSSIAYPAAAVFVASLIVTASLGASVVHHTLETLLVFFT